MSRPDPSPPADAAIRTSEPSNTYVSVQLTTDPLPVERAHTAFQWLHRTCWPNATGALARLSGRADPPTIECLLIADGNGSVEYLLGVDDPKMGHHLSGVLDRVFPASAAFEPVVRPGTQIEDLRQPPDTPLAAVEFVSTIDDAGGWQRPLRRFETYRATEYRQPSVPLGAVCETLAAQPSPMVYQVVARALPSWDARADDRQVRMSPNDTEGAAQASTTSRGTHAAPPAETPVRRDTHHTFLVSARAIAIGVEERSATDAVDDLIDAFADLGGPHHRIQGVPRGGDAASDLFAALCDRTVFASAQNRVANWWPLNSRESRGMILDAAELPALCLLDGRMFGKKSRLALAPPPDHPPIRPPRTRRRDHDVAGMHIGTPLTRLERDDGAPLVVSPGVQSHHIGWIAGTDSQRTAGLVNAIRSNHRTTAGPNVVIDQGTAGLASAYLRAHHAAFGTFDDVLYFDCTTVLPGFEFFDVRWYRALGGSRAMAVEYVADWYLDILEQVVGRDDLTQVERAPQMIRDLLRALFDEEHGHDQFTHRDLCDLAHSVHDERRAPSVTDTDVAGRFEDLVTGPSWRFDEVMTAVTTRLEQVEAVPSLSRLLNHRSDRDDPRFAFDPLLDEDVVVVFALGGLDPTDRDAVLLVILTQLYGALRRRGHVTDDVPLTNLYLDKGESIAGVRLRHQLLARGRGYNCAITLAMRFTGNLRAYGPDAYDEVMDQLGTLIVGQLVVDLDKGVLTRLANELITETTLSNLLLGLSYETWLVDRPRLRMHPPSRPSLVRAPSLPPDDTDVVRPLSDTDHARRVRAIGTLRERTRTTVGITR